MIYWRTDVYMMSSLKLFKILYYIKQIDSKLPCVCSAPRVPLFCSYHILTSSVIYYWTDARQLGIYLLNSKRVTRAVKIVDSCSRENGFLCTVARSWLLFLHDESEWKHFESNIGWGVDELHQTFWFEQFFNSNLCCNIHDLLSVAIIFFWIGLLSVIPN